MATVAVEVSPGQSVMYPLCPYQAAWKPGVPEGTLAGGGMPGPTLDVHGAAVSDCWLARTGTPRVRAHTTSATLANTPPTRVLIRAIATQHAVCLGALDDRPPVLSRASRQRVGGIPTIGKTLSPGIAGSSTAGRPPPSCKRDSERPARTRRALEWRQSSKLTKAAHPSENRTQPHPIERGSGRPRDSSRESSDTGPMRTAIKSPLSRSPDGRVSHGCVREHH